MTDETVTPASMSGVWRRLWRFLKACEMSTAEVHDLRIDALERRVAKAWGPAVTLEEISHDLRGAGIGADVRGPQQRSL